VTTPGGVPNLPVGALTLDTLASKTQDVTPTAMKARAAGRFSSIFSSSTGLDPASSITPFGILTTIFGGFNSTVANADPADVDGPEDLPGLLIDFIESLPFVGQFVELFQAILGNYTGTDTTLLGIQNLFAPIRAVVDAFTALVPGGNFLGFLSPSSSGSGIFAPLINGILGGTGNPLSSLFSNLLGTASTASTANTNANTGLSNWSSLLGGLPGVSSISSLLSFLNPASSSNGIFAPLINLVTGGTTNPLSTLGTSLTTTASTTSTNSTNITSLITNLFGGSSILSQVQPGAVGGVTSGASLLTDVQTFLNNIFGGITKNTNTTTSQGDALDAVSSQSNTVITTAGTMQQILAALGTGTPDSDDFERTSSSNLGANWNQQQTGTGVLATPNGHDASSTGTGSSYEFTARKTNKVASTDHQTSTIVLASAFPSYPFFTPLPYGGYIDVWVRMSAFTTFATRTGLRFRVNGNPPYQATWTIDWVNSGTVTNLASGTLPSIPGAAASIAFEVGVGGNNLAYQGRVNGTPVANFTDSTTRGLGNTGRGFGGKGNSGVGTNQGVPSVQQWTAQG
jgi:hypothetical protein